ncbi:MAG TPA: hypothetical protein VIL84_12650 [Devosiaceae bacterium]
MSVGAPDGNEHGHEVLFEIAVIGRQARIAAIDVQSGREVVVIAPANATEAQMKALALARLRRALSRRD